MSDPMDPYANETPEQAAEHARQIAEQAALEAGEKNVPPAAPPEIPIVEDTSREAKSRK